MAAVVGTAYIRLRLLTDTVGKDIAKSIEKSDLQDVNIQVDADTAKADAELEATGLKADQLGRKDPTITPKVNTKQAEKQTHLLMDALVALGPTIGPLGGAAAAAFAGVAAGAAVGVLAVLGVKKEMKDATKTGVAFSGGLQTLKADLSTLERTAARGVLPGFQGTVTSLNTALPGVNRSVAVLSREFGDMAGHVVVGLVAGLKTFEPLLVHIGLEADTAAKHFQDWSTGPGGAQFATTIGREFDLVIPVLAHLAEAAGKLVSAFLPVGNQIVGVVGALADAIDAIPLPVLQTAATLFVTLYSANRLITMFRNLSISIAAFGTSARAASLGVSGLAASTATFTRALGVAAAAGVAVAQGISFLNNALNDSAEKFAVSDKVTTNLTESFTKSKGAIDAGVISAQQYNLQQSGLADRAARSGISLDQLTQALVGPRKGFDELIDTWKASGDPSAQTLDAFRELRVQMFLSQDATKQQSTAQTELSKTLAAQWPALRTTSASVQQVAANLHVSSDAVTQFASLVGISNEAIKAGTVTNQQLANAVMTVSSAYNNATATGATFLDALAKFSTSAGTAADRAQLIGAYLIAAQGDMLSFQGAVASGYQANIALTNSFEQQADQVKAGTLALNETSRAAINLKTGMIDVTQAGAGPLIQSLQGMQDAAMAAASATYQHEVATKGAGKAASDAAKIFKTETYDALVKDAAQLGLTAGQAKKLADKYFALPKDVATRVRTIGTDPVVTVLNRIGAQLALLTHHPWTTTVNARTAAAESQLRTLRNHIASFPSVIQVTALVYATQGAAKRGATGGLVSPSGIQYRARGGPAGMVVGPGTGKSDTAGLFALSNGEWVTDAVTTRRYLPVLQAMSRSRGMASGGPVPSGGGGFDTAALLAEIRALAAALADRPVQLVATNGGRPLAKVVNDANQVNARRSA